MHPAVLVGVGTLQGQRVLTAPRAPDGLLGTDLCNWFLFEHAFCNAFKKKKGKTLVFAKTCLKVEKKAAEFP